MNKINLLLVVCLLMNVNCQHKTGELYPVKLQGKFKTVGSEPLTELVFSAADGKDYVIHTQSLEACKNFKDKKSLRIEGFASELHAYSKKIDKDFTTYFLQVKKIQTDDK